MEGYDTLLLGQFYANQVGSRLTLSLSQRQNHFLTRYVVFRQAIRCLQCCRRASSMGDPRKVADWARCERQYRSSK